MGQAFLTGFENGRADYFESARGGLPNDFEYILSFGKEYVAGYLEGWLGAFRSNVLRQTTL